MFFYAILFGVMLGLCSDFGPFQFHRLFHLSKSERFDIFHLSEYDYLSSSQQEEERDMVFCKKCRLVFSFLILNISPIVYFYFIVY
jgi:hypothetical protein